jgi:hypothetical protein
MTTTTTPTWDQHFGEALQRIKTAQTLPPAANRDAAPAAGMDAAAAVHAQNQYLHSYEAPPEPPQSTQKAR